MKNLFFLLAIIFSFRVTSQQTLDTVFYPIYGNSQLLIVKQKQWYPETKAFIATAKNAEELKNLPIYIFRNNLGEVTKTYNDFNNLDKRLFTRDNLHKEEPIAHKIKAKNTSNNIGNDDSGYNQLYPIYNCQFNDYKVCSSFKVGLMDTMGNLVFPIEFDHIQYIDSTFIVKKDKSYYLYDATFKPINNIAYDSIIYSDFVHNQLIVKKEGLYGMINRFGKEQLPMKYKIVQKSRYMTGNYEFLEGNLYGFISWDTKRYLAPFSPVAEIYSRDGFFVYKAVNDWNVIDSSGKKLLKTNYQVFNIINRNRFVVGPNYQERILIDSKNRMISDKFYHDIWKINENTLMVGSEAGKIDASDLIKSAKWQLVDINFQLKNKDSYKTIQKLDDDFLKVWDSKNNFHLVDDAGNEAVDLNVSDAYKYAEGVYKLVVDGKHLFIDLKNPAKRSNYYDNLMCARENRISVQKDGLWGFIDYDFREICPIKADRVTCFEDGIATIEINKQFYIMDSTGKLLSPEYFDFAENVKNGYCRVGRDGKYGLLHKKGYFTIPLMYGENNFLVNQKGTYYLSVRMIKGNGKYGIVNQFNEVIHPFIYDNCVELSVYASIEQKRTDGFYVFAQIEKRSTWEYYYLNFDDSKSQLKIQENQMKGFKIVEGPCPKNETQLTKCSGVINWDGKQIIPFIYGNIKPLKNNTFTVYSLAGGGILDTNGKVVIPPIYKYVYELGSDCDLIQVGRHYGGWGLYDYSGKMLADTLYGGFEKPVFGLIPFRNHPNYHFNESKEYVHDEMKYGFMDLNGRIIIEPSYQRYQIPNPKKEEILLIDGSVVTKINGRGQVLEGALLPPQKPTIVHSVPPKRKWWKFWGKKRARWM
jgi:hypothetical protein